MTKMIKKIFFIALLFPVSLPLLLGQDMATFLTLIKENNPEIIAYGKLLDAKKHEVRTGITPPDPSVSFGYMPGTTEETGTKTTWSVSQSFSFPTRYILLGKISKNNLVAAEEEYQLGTLNTLLNAKLLLYDLIYDTRTLDILSGRKELYDRMKTAWGKMVESGEATILEYNRILLGLSSLNLRISRISSDIVVLKQKLGYMSNGNFVPSSYPNYFPESETDTESLIADKQRIHPAFMLPETEYQISLQEVKLARTGSLPEFQAGVSSESVPGETFTGPVAGITLPLWSNNNKVKTAISKSDHSAAKRDAILLELRTGVRSEYENMKALKTSMDETGDIIAKSDNRQFLDKALSAGELSVTDYFIYIESYFQAEDKFYELENEYHKSLARLYDQNLLR
jgi:cobalt-zinc-cadmium efflux system outer membrane protein